jgi:hypothetical protein
MVRWEDITTDWCGTLVPTLDPKRDGASITFRVPVAVADRYQIQGFLAKGRDYGRIACSVDGHPSAVEANTFADSETVPAGAVTLARALLSRGEHEITLGAAGRKPDGWLPRISVDKFLLVSDSAWIRDWQVIGPFNLRGVDDPDPCETDGFVPGKSYEGTNGMVTWQPLKAKRNGFLPVGECVGAKTHSRAYAFTRVISPDDRETELLMGAVDGMKAYVNGKEVFRVGGYRPAEPDQHRAKVKLHRGENTLLMKVLVLGNAGIYARFRDPAGELRYSAEP